MLFPTRPEPVRPYPKYTVKEPCGLAGEIHDDALQAMSAVLMRLGMVARVLSDPSEQAAIEHLAKERRRFADHARLERFVVIGV